MIIDRSPIITSRDRSVDFEIWISSAIGAIFCHVDKMKPVDSEIPWRTSGIQKCSGASPSFIHRAIVIGIEIVVDMDWMSHSPNAHVFTIAANRIRAEAAA